MGLIYKLYGVIFMQLLLFEAIHGQLRVSYSLYSENDSVIILDKDNFEHYVYNQNAFTIVNFYVHWCGHCVKFSPIWKQFARDIKGWKTIVRVAAFNCALDKNTELCQRHGINSFPRVQIFSINAQNNDSGLRFNLENQSVLALRTQLIDFLFMNQKSFANRLNIFPVSVASKAELFNTISIDLEKHNLIFVEDRPTHLGAEIVMDFSSYDEYVKIIRVHDRNGNLKVDLFPYYIRLPSLIQIHRNQQISLIASAHSGDEESLREEFGAHIRQLLPVEAQTIEQVTDKLNNSSIDTNTRAITPKKLPPLSMTDLYNTLKYSLYQEVSRYTVLNNTQIVALKNYFSTIYKYFPFNNENVRRFFKRMNHWFSNKSNKLNIENLRAAMKISDGYLIPIVDWRHCNGSKPQFRGYPCGLWSLFHVMTVKEYTSSQNNSHEVLETMRDFIINFFSCESCAKHFAQISNGLESHLTERESSVLWLWRIHNQVNQRLHGDLSEDPFYPKVQFPTQTMCQNCYKSNNEYDEEHVLEFLIQHYDERKLSANKGPLLSPSTTFFLFIYLLVLFMYW